MKNIAVLLVLLISLQSSAISQSKFQLLVAGGPTFTSDIKYNNCTGHINTTLTGSLGLIYRPDSTFGIELKFSGLLHPTSYLNNDTDYTVKAYTTSHIVFQRVLAGFNYYLPVKGIQPFLGLIAGASFAQTTAISPESSIYNFNWGFQAGATLNIAKSTALRLDACTVFIPNVYNNSSYFNGAADGTGFPSFIIGDPSKATITQWNINLGLVINLGKTNK
jgi:hypothetical protein